MATDDNGAERGVTGARPAQPGTRQRALAPGRWVDRASALRVLLPLLGLPALAGFAGGAVPYAAVCALTALLGLLLWRRGRARPLTSLPSAERAAADDLARAGIGTWEFDPASGHFELSDVGRRLCGAPAARPIGLDTFAARCSTASARALRQALAAGAPFDLELECAGDADASEPEPEPGGAPVRWLRFVGSPRDRRGGIGGLLHDVSAGRAAQAALAEQRHLLTLLMQTTVEGYWFVDAEGRVTDVNPAMCGLLRSTREALLGRHVFELADAANQVIFGAELERRAHGASSGYEVTMQRPDGTPVEVFINATLIFDTAGRRLGSIGMVTDISERKHTEQRLRATSEQLAQQSRALQLTLDSISQGIVGWDAQGRITVHNQRALEMLEFSESLLADGARFDDLVRFQTERGDFDGGLRFIDPHTHRFVAATDFERFSGHYVRRLRSGGHLEVRTRTLPDGGMVRTYADVSAYFAAQHALHESEAQLRTLFNAFPGFISVVGPELVYEYVNDHFAAFLGRSRDQVIGHPLHEFLSAERIAQIAAFMARTDADAACTVESRHEPSPTRPQVAWLQVTEALGADDGSGRRNCYAFGIDISARKLAEAALIAAKDEAERANRAKSQFLSSMSHELRTPMNAILGFGQLLVSDPDQPLAGRQPAHVREILRGARHLLRLINEVLDLSQVEAGRLRITLEPVDVAPLLAECIALLEPLAGRAAIRMELGGDATGAVVHADRTRLQQVLLNLLSNAIKYNRPGGLVRIACHADGAGLRVAIADTGAGIGADQRERLFQAFERLDAWGTSIEGAGLGLALSRRFMDAMGGEIGLESDVGRGSTFWIRLPRALAPAPVPPAAGTALLALPAPASAAASAPPTAKRRKVLYIEDNPVNTMLMEAMLARLDGVDVITASLPGLGLRLAEETSPDLILLDIQLPGIDGFEVLRRLRLQPGALALPVIAVSANAMPDDIARGEAAGFDAYLSKPLDLTLLLAAVQQALARPRALA